MPIIQPTRGTPIVASCYGKSKVPIMQPTRGTQNGIRRCGRAPFYRPGPLVFAPRSSDVSMAGALANDTTGTLDDANDAQFRTITGDAAHPTTSNRTPWASGSSLREFRHPRTPRNSDIHELLGNPDTGNPDTPRTRRCGIASPGTK